MVVVDPHTIGRPQEADQRACEALLDLVVRALLLESDAHASGEAVEQRPQDRVAEAVVEELDLGPRERDPDQTHVGDDELARPMSPALAAPAQPDRAAASLQRREDRARQPARRDLGRSGGARLVELGQAIRDDDDAAHAPRPHAAAPRSRVIRSRVPLETAIISARYSRRCRVSRKFSRANSRAFSPIEARTSGLSSR